MRREDRVLIVEDNASVANAIEAAGQEFCYTCDRASDGWEAIEKLETEQYAAIVIDTDVPRRRRTDAHVEPRRAAALQPFDHRRVTARP